MNELDPKDLVDRKTEQELFSSLLEDDSPARILTICDRGGQGKSCLLRRLRWNCAHQIKPPVPACLLELDQLGDPSPFTFISNVVQNVLARGERIRDSFVEFNRLNEARGLRDFTPFINWRRPPSSTPVRLATDLGEAITAQPVRVEHLEMIHHFTEEQEQRAQERCIDAFFDDLRTICATRPMVLLLDAWERCTPWLHDWILEEMVGNHIVHPDVSLRPRRFYLVIAGRRCGRDIPHGLRGDEFRPFFDSDAEMSETIRSISSLSEWQGDHVRAFMALNGYHEPDQETVEWIRSSLRRGYSLVKVMALIEILGQEASPDR